MRNTGQTLAMVEALPETGSIVVVHTGPLRAYVRRMIVDIRGSEVLGVTKVVTVRDRGDIDQFQGIRKPVFVDHAARAALSPVVLTALDLMVARAHTGLQRAG